MSAVFRPEKESYTFAEVVQIVAESLRSQINREHLENLFAYNVANQKNFILRAVPLFIKNIAIRYVYHTSALANTTTVTDFHPAVHTFSHSSYTPFVSICTGMPSSESLRKNLRWTEGSARLLLTVNTRVSL